MVFDFGANLFGNFLALQSFGSSTNLYFTWFSSGLVLGFKTSLVEVLTVEFSAQRRTAVNFRLARW